MPLKTARVSGLLLAVALFAAPAAAQIVQSLHLSGGVFVPRGYDARERGDVLVENFAYSEFSSCDAVDRASCIRREFTSGQGQAEWLFGVGNHLEFGAGVGFFASSAPIYNIDYTHPNGTDIEQDESLRVIPVSAVVRFLGGRPGRFQPYFGVGVSALNFRYTESGEFIDFAELDATGAFVTFRNRYTATGTVFGPLVMAGFRAPINGDVYNFTMEWRYQGGVGNTGGLPAGFLADKIDLGGNNISFGFLVRF